MSDTYNSNRPAAGKPRSPKTWDFMETTFVALIAYAVFLLTAGFGVSIILLVQYGVEDLSPSLYRAIAMRGHWYGAALIIAFAPTLAVLWVAIQRAGREFTEYLALNWPSRNEMLLAFAVTAVFLLVESEFLPSPPVNSPYIVEGAGGMFVLLVGGCLAGPIMEEFAFRGFMFRGWSESFLGPIGAIVLTSALFGMYHTQYDWPARFWIFLFGLVLCVFAGVQIRPG